MQVKIHTILGLFLILVASSCVDRFEKIEKYQRPEWLEGKLYTQIDSQSNMNIFSQFILDCGYDKVLDKTGTYAAFVPSDSVMEIYLMQKYGTIDPSKIDSTVKSNLVKYHILQMPWSIDQLQTLSTRGWINMNDVSNNKPTAFKRKTLLREPNKEYKIQRFLSGDDPYDIILPNTSTSSEKRIVFSNTPKYAPLFFDGFMNASKLSSSDYSFYFNRAYEPGQIYYANAKVTGEELFAENGFIYTVDQVVEPLKNAEQILEDGPYSDFLQLVHNFSVFQFNQQATLSQEGADQGLEVDDLYDLKYSSLEIAIHNELVGTANQTYENHNALLAPTNEAMSEFFNTYFRSYGSNWSSVPRVIQQLFVEAHMASEPVYEKDIYNGFYNGINDIVDNSDIEIEEAIFGSNCTFIGLKKAIVPKYLSSVSASLILNPSLNSFFNAYQSVGLLSALKDKNSDFSVFYIDDNSLSIDSTLFVFGSTGSRTMLMAYDHAQEKLIPLMGGEYRGPFRRKLMGHIGIQPLLGQAKREFIETIDGRHIVVQNDTVSGGVSSEFGLNTGRDTTVVFSEITTSNITNGRVFRCNGWLKFPTTNTYRHLAGTKFVSLLNKAGMASTLNERVTFMNEFERYTIFVPSDSALTSVNADSLSIDELKDLLSFHIVKGEFIFTDGRQPMGAYLTLNNKRINLDPRPDNLLILDANNNIYYDQLVLSNRSNLMGMFSQDISEMYYSTNAVVHHINKVIMPY